MKFLAGLLCALCLAGCQTGGVVGIDGSAMPNASVGYQPEVDYRGMKVAGLTSYAALWAYVLIDSDMDPDRRQAVIVHELLHVAGLKPHSYDRSCYIYVSGKDRVQGSLCPAEYRRLLRGMVRNVRVVCLDSANYREVALAVAFLNAELGDHPYRFILETS